MSDKPMLTIYNRHVEDCGEPPMLTNNVKPGTVRYGYFENEHGEQWIFTYEYATREATLRGGDTGWDEVHKVIDGQVTDLMLTTAELMWLKACWLAAACQG